VLPGTQAQVLSPTEATMTHRHMVHQQHRVNIISHRPTETNTDSQQRSLIVVVHWGNGPRELKDLKMFHSYITNRLLTCSLSTNRLLTCSLSTNRLLTCSLSTSRLLTCSLSTSLFVLSCPLLDLLDHEQWSWQEHKQIWDQAIEGDSRSGTRL
jgi:hypothetical protein